MTSAEVNKISSHGFFVTGTDTGIGKTLVASALIKKLVQQDHKVAGMKPVASGCEKINGHWQNDDALAMMAASNVELPYKLVNPYAFEPAIAPHLAAGLADENISISLIKNHYHQLESLADKIIVEGAGGWLAPISEHETMADIALALDLPVILVVGMRLGCLNHSLLTVQSIVEKGAKLAGWVANGIDPLFKEIDENIETLKSRISAPCLGIVPCLDQGIELDAIPENLNISASFN